MYQSDEREPLQAPTQDARPRGYCARLGWVSLMILPLLWVILELLHTTKLPLSAIAIPPRSSQWTITVVAVDHKGHSYFTTKRIPLGPVHGPNSIGALSAVMPVTGLVVRDTPAGYDFDWHVAPHKQFVVNLDAAVEIEVSDGTKKVLRAGEMFLLEDTKGQGHRSKSVNGQPRRSLFITVAA